MGTSVEQALIGQVVLGEHRLEKLARADGALAIFEATSVVDGGPYTVVVAHEVRVETAATALDEAIERAGRHAVGVKGLTSLLLGRALPLAEGARLAVVRRGPPGASFHSASGGRPLPIAEVVEALTPIASTLATLHDQGMVHGALCPSTVTIRNGAMSLDFFGIAGAAEAACGARGYRDLLPEANRPPELRGERPSVPGPWTDIAGLALLALELLCGKSPAGGLAPRALGVPVPNRVQDLFERSLADAPRLRPLDARAFLRELMAAARDPVVPLPHPASPLSSPSRSEGEAPTPAPSPVVPVVPGAAPAGATSEAEASAPEARSGTPTTAGRAGEGASPAPREAGTARNGEADGESEARWIGWAIAVGVLGLLMGVGGAMVLLVRASSKGATPAVASATAGPSSLPSSPAARHGMPTAPRRGIATYPADHEALVPVPADSPVWGDRDALVTVVLFGDLTCPFTAHMLTELPRVAERLDGDLRVVFKHYPLPSREDAQAASEAASITFERGKSDAFWRFVEGATRDEQRLDPGRLEELGIRAGLPAGAVTEALQQKSQRPLLTRDIELGRRLAVRGTPVLFFNGRRVDGEQPLDLLLRLAEYERRKTQELLAKGTPRDQLYARRVQANLTTAEGEKPIQ